jgi:hypothetical protein
LLPERGNFFSKLSQLAFLATNFVPVGNIFRIPPIRLNRTKSFYDPLFAFQKNFSSLSFYIQGLRPVVTTLTTRPNFFIFKIFSRKNQGPLVNIFLGAPSKVKPRAVFDTRQSQKQIFANLRLKTNKNCDFFNHVGENRSFCPAEDLAQLDPA